MKISWIMAVVTLYLLILGCELMVIGGTGGSSFDNIVTTNQSVMIQPSVASSGSVSSGDYSLFQNVGNFLKVWIPIFTLTSPAVFSGHLIWFWWFVCFPIDCAMVFAVMTVIRGVGSH